MRRFSNLMVVIVIGERLTIAQAIRKVHKSHFLDKRNGKKASRMNVRTESKDSINMHTREGGGGGGPSEHLEKQLISETTNKER